MAIMDKPMVVEKVHKFVSGVRKNGGKIGTIPRGLVINYNNVCNFRCEFCFSSETNNEHLKDELPLETIRRVADEAHELGMWEMVIVGGELTVNQEKLLKLIECIGSERFLMILITNGYLMTRELAEKLKTAGLDCVAVSLSGMDAEEHDRSRGNVKGAHQRALQALDYVTEAGMDAWPNVIFGHHNSHSEDLHAILDYADEHGYTTYLMLAAPFGTWKNNVMDAEDVRILSEIRKKHNCFFDTWDMYDRKKENISGCWSVNKVYITPKGDVLPCSYLHISIGNINEQPLKEILDYGFSIKYFGEYSPICISAMNLKFREKYLPDGSGDIFNPLNAKDIFSEDDYIK